jgi:hypothetical protein
MSALLLVALLGLQTPLDQGTLVIREDTAEVARETFQLSQVRIGLRETGWRLAARARCDRNRPVVALPRLVDIVGDFPPVRLAPALRIRGEVARQRLTVRYLGRRVERAREVPITGPAVILDDSVFAPYVFAAWRARQHRVDLLAVVPRGDRREVVTVEDLGSATTTVNGDPATLRHIRLTGGANEVVHLWLNANGFLDKIEIPSRHLRVERLPPA